MPTTRSSLKLQIPQCLIVFFFMFWHMKITWHFFLNNIIHKVNTGFLHIVVLSVFGDSVAHSHLTGLFHHNPRDKAPLWTQHTESWKILEAVFNIFQAPIIFPKCPLFIHKPCMGGIQGNVLKASFPVKKKKRAFIQPTFTKHQDCRKWIWHQSFPWGSHSLEEETGGQKTNSLSPWKCSQIIKRAITLCT